MPASAVISVVGLEFPASSSSRGGVRLTPTGTGGRVEHWLLSANRQEDVAVTRRCRYHWAALLGLWLAPVGVGWAQAPGEPGPLGLTPADALPTRVASNNQKMADLIADQLRQG